MFLDVTPCSLANSNVLNTLQPPSSTVKDKRAGSSETLVNVLQTTQCTMLEDIIHVQHPTSHASTNGIKGMAVKTPVKAQQEGRMRDAQHKKYQYNVLTNSVS